MNDYFLDGVESGETAEAGLKRQWQEELPRAIDNAAYFTESLRSTLVFRD
jgi:NADH pyrophosphatase NudC (nudix superfamily)